MINRIYKTIHNKYSRFFKFIFFLRYVFLVFFISIALFLLIPNFFDYKKKENIIKSLIFKNYALKIEELEDIKFKSFPIPHLEIKNLNSKLFSNEINIKTKTLKIYPRIENIYNFNNFNAKKIKLYNSEVEIDANELNVIWKSTFEIKEKIYFSNLNIKINDSENFLIDLKKINFLNYGYKKNQINGEIFGRKFDIRLKDGLKKINFKIDKAGISAELNFFENDQNFISIGNLKAKILNSKLLLDFINNQSAIKIQNSIFRSKNLSINSNGEIRFTPFFSADLNSEIKNLDSDLIKSFNFEKLLNSKGLLKRMNIKNTFTFEPNKFDSNIFDKIFLKTNLSYGRLEFSKKISISETDFNCDGNINLVEDFPSLTFKCLMILKDKKKFLKKFDIKYKIRDESLKLKFKGKMNILNRKVKFDLIEVNENFKASKEDLNYFKTTFENILFDQNFINIFNRKKIRKFLKEIS